MMQLCKPVVALPAALYLLAMEQTRRIGKRLGAGLKSEIQGSFFTRSFQEGQCSLDCERDG